MIPTPGPVPHAQVYLEAGIHRDQEANLDTYRCALFQLPVDVFVAWLNNNGSAEDKTIVATYLQQLQANCTEVCAYVHWKGLGRLRP